MRSGLPRTLSAFTLAVGPGVLVSRSLGLLNLMHTPTATDAETRLTKVTITVSFGMPHGKAGPHAKSQLFASMAVRS